jgi:Glycosyl transferase family 2/Glycosyl transferases group 1
VAEDETVSGNGDSTLRDAGADAGDAARRDLDSAFARLEEMRLQTDLLAEGLREVEEAKAASDELARVLRMENVQLAEQLDRAREDRDRIQDRLAERGHACRRTERRELEADSASEGAAAAASLEAPSVSEARMKLAFVGTSRGNVFMNELLAAVAHEAGALGVEAELVLDRFPDGRETAYVVIPHEYFATVPESRHPSDDQLRRTVAFCVEQPGTSWFEFSCVHARRTAAVLDIGRSAVLELNERGIAAEHFQLGYSSCWDVWHGDHSVERPVDVLFLGTETGRRIHVLAGYASSLWSLESRILVAPEAPKPGPRADFLVGEEKWTALRSAKTLLNVHREGEPYFEWVRVLEAIANGCVVISEHSNDVSPLVPGEHFVRGRVENLALLANGLLRDEERLTAVRTAAYDFVRNELSMRPAAQRLVEVAEHVASEGRGSPTIPMPARAVVPADLETADPGAGADDASRQARITLKRLRLGALDVSRLIGRAELRLRGVDPFHLEVVATSRAFAEASPRVSALVPLYNHAHDVGRALASIAASEFESLEVLVLDDGSTDGSAKKVLEFLERRRELPAALLRHPVNRGLGATRNDLASHARGELVLMLDADNEVFPTAISRLVRALDDDPSASFAYPMLEVHENGTPWTLLSYFPWEPERLRAANYIDALALLRREQLIDVGGYTEDPRLHGLEDWDLWCRYAERRMAGVLVPQILARYSHTAGSMRSITSLDLTEAEDVLRERYPKLMGSKREVSAGASQALP